MRVGGRGLEWQKIQVDNYRDERREEVESEVMMKNTLRGELNCQVDAERIRGVSVCLGVTERLPAVFCLLFILALIRYLSQAEMDTWELIAIQYALGLGDLVRKSHIVILWVTLRFAVGRLTDT